MRRFLAFLVLFASFVIPAPLFADVPAYDMQKNKSFIKFFAIVNDAPLEGKFNNFTADIHFDPNHLDDASVRVEVDMGSVEVSNTDVAQNIKLPEWFSTAAFPKAVFICKKMTRMPGSDNYYANGQLTIRDKTIPVVLNFQMEHFDDTNAVVTGYVSIKRRDFGIGQGEWSRDDVVKNEVRIEFRVAAVKK